MNRPGTTLYENIKGRIGFLIKPLTLSTKEKSIINGLVEELERQQIRIGELEKWRYDSFRKGK